MTRKPSIELDTDCLPLMVTDEQALLIVKALHYTRQGEKLDRERIVAKAQKLLGRRGYVKVETNYSPISEGCVFLSHSVPIPWRKIIDHFLKKYGPAQASMRLDIPEHVLSLLTGGIVAPVERLQRRLLNSYAMETGKAVSTILREAVE